MTRFACSRSVTLLQTPNDWWQADEQCRRDAYDEAGRAKKNGISKRVVVVDPMKDTQEELK